MTIRRLLFCMGLVVVLDLLVLTFMLHRFSTVEIIFDVNRLDVENVVSHPHIRVDKFNPAGRGFTFRTPAGTYGRYSDTIDQVTVGCTMGEDYQTFRSLGFTHWQILGAKQFAPNRYRVKVGRIYEVNFSRFEQSLGHGRGIDRATIRWEND